MKCNYPQCSNLALSLADFCWDHIPDRDAYRATLLGAIHSGKDLSGFNLQKIVLSGARLEKAELTGTNLSQADLSGTHIFDSNLNGADLVGANLAHCDLAHSSFKDADLTKANVAQARLWHTDLTGANLIESDFTKADFWNTRLFNVKLWHTKFDDAASLSRLNFTRTHKFYEEAKVNEGGILSAQEAYRDLKRYFIMNAMNDDASWASFKEMTMARINLKKKWDLTYIPSLLMALLCGYGEKPYRIVLSALITIIGFGTLYLMMGAIQGPISPDYTMRWSDYYYFSTVTFTTVGYGDFIPKSQGIFRLMAACEAFSGVFLSGLFVFTLARKYSAR